MQQKEKNINSFWVAYGDAVVDSGIPEAMAKWYVRWARKFAAQQTIFRYYGLSWVPEMESLIELPQTSPS